MFQREKVEVQLPELFHKIGERWLNSLVSSNKRGYFNLKTLLFKKIGSFSHVAVCTIMLFSMFIARCGCHDLVTFGLWDHLREIWRQGASVLTSLSEGSKAHLLSSLHCHRSVLSTRSWSSLFAVFLLIMFVSSRFDKSVPLHMFVIAMNSSVLPCLSSVSTKNYYIRACYYEHRAITVQPYGLCIKQYGCWQL